MDLSPVTYMDPESVIFSLNGSVDMGNSEYCFICGHHNCQDPDAGDHTQAMLESLLNSKLQECTKNFIKSVVTSGIERPICIEVDFEGKWWQGNGHHRLAVALEHNLQFIPVVFSFDDDYMHENTTESGYFPEFCD